ncbi:DUF808 domain-containing protein [Pseudomonas frederiksbergensis]
MASGSLFILIDDIAMILDDVAAQTKVAASKTAGVLGDDLALNAQQVTGVRADRELPVVWAVAKGSLLNKAILVPGALLVSALAPWAIMPALMLGGAYLCFEGVEKILHAVLGRRDRAAHEERKKALSNEAVDMVSFERERIRGAIRTDAVLSLELLVLTMAVVAGAPLLEQFLTLVVISLILTGGVYGFVAALVRLDDMGLHLSTKSNRVLSELGRALLWSAPVMMKSLAIVGTAAMLVVGGSIVLHGVPALHHFSESLISTGGYIGGYGLLLAGGAGVIIDGMTGFATGGLLLGLVAVAKSMFFRFRAA